MRQVMTARTDPRPVAVVRIALGIAAAMMAVEAHLILMKVAAGRLAMPTFGLIPTPSDIGLLVLLIVALTAAAALLVGYRTTLAAGLTVLSQLSYFMWDQQTYSNHRTLLMLLACYLIFARSDTAWSLRPPARRPTAVPYWPQMLMMSQVSALYLFAGLSKINPIFLQGHMLKAEVWWPLPQWVLVSMSVATVLTEVFLAIGLWMRRVRWLAAGVGVLLHLSIVTMLRDPVVLVAFALACVPLYALFLARPLRSRNPGTAAALRQAFDQPEHRRLQMYPELR